MNVFAGEATKGAAALGRGATTKNPFEVAYSLIDERPGVDKATLFEPFNDQLFEDQELQRAVNYWFFCNAHSYATTSRNRKSGSHLQAIIEQKAAVVAEIKARIVLLDFPMTNGKLLGDCTGAELAKMGNRYQKLADRIGKAKTLREVLTEEQVQEIMK